jgi:P27 family predicted phage terminase small subunit
MGRPRKPSAQKIAEGNPGKRPIGADPEVRGRVCAPSWLSGGGRRVWRRHVPELVRLGLVTPLDVETMGQWCEQVALVQTCTRRIDLEGVTVEVNGQIVPHPCMGMRLKAIVAARQLGNLLGLNPSARAGLAVAGEGEDEFSAWERGNK